MSGGPERYPAVFYDGRTARRLAVTVVPGPDGFTIERDGAPGRFWRYADLRLMQGGEPGEPVRLERDFPEARGVRIETIVVDDPAFWRTIEAGGKLRSEHGLRAVRPLEAALAFIGAAAIGLWVYLWGATAVGAALAAVAPQAWEERLGEIAASQIAPEDDRCSDRVMLESVQTIVDRLLEAKDVDYEYRLVVADGDINAFAAPGGYLILWNGLLRKTDSPEELAGVLAHEIEHVERRHSTRSIFRDMTWRALIAAMTGGDAGGAAGIGSMISLANLAHHRDAEASADRGGLDRMIAAGVDPEGMVEIFRKFQEMEGEGADAFVYFSTHPSTSERIEYLETAAAEAEVETKPLLPSVNWRRVRRACR